MPQRHPKKKLARQRLKRSRRRRRPRMWYYAFIFAASMMCVSAAVGVGVFMGYVSSLPPIENLEYYNPPEVSMVFDRSGQQVVGEFKQEKRFVTPIDRIPERLQNAFIAIEDSRFYQHFGVDVIGIMRAMVENFKAGSLRQGGSTITQQLTRNILPERVGRARNLERKIKEAILALQIERRYSKKQILEFYLNHIPFNYNSFGVRAAAMTYFSKEMDDLTVAECAVLASMPKGPTAYNPFKYPERVTKRRNLVLQRMRELEMINEETYQAAVEEPLAPRYGSGPPSQHPYFIDALRRELQNTYGLSDEQLYAGGLQITSTVDPRMQDACVKALREGLLEVEKLIWEPWRRNSAHNEQVKEWDGVLRPGVWLMKVTEVREGELDVELNWYRATLEIPDPAPFYDESLALKEGQWLDVAVSDVDQATGRVTGTFAVKRPVQGSVVVLDAHTGEVLALVGGTNFHDPFVGGWNRAIQGGRQPGSCFKPFFYAAAFEKGYDPADIIVDEAVEYNRKYKPINYEKTFFGPTTLVEALEHSRNVVTIRLFETLGLKSTVDFVKRFDFTRSSHRWTVPPELAICLGTIDTAPLEMAAAYQVFANQGVARRPNTIRSIVDPDGQIQVPLKHFEKPILDPVAAYQTQYLLRQVVLNGTGRSPIGNPFPSPPNPPVCGKTGTTDDCRDAWFCGFTPDLVIAVQVGYDTPVPMGPKMTGSQAAGPIWAAAFRDIIKTRETWRMSFDAPPGIELADICTVTGKRVSEICYRYGHRIYTGVPFERERKPIEQCNDVPRAPIIAPVGEQYRYLASIAEKWGFAQRPEPEELTYRLGTD